MPQSVEAAVGGRGRHRRRGGLGVWRRRWEGGEAEAAWRRRWEGGGGRGGGEEAMWNKCASGFGLACGGVA
ncbi:hypothetical protein GUJ93_ZPchr0010g8031 [Zizania palustris]|uniref:Uncharacterized protein n=1 Tax=Zizania palustris TaxID=103762 RepID=A0A8J6BC55_ZIZPA|nr:hypothetical protein GUJ93_ZPchr0010g8031 [Zizania palustris]